MISFGNPEVVLTKYIGETAEAVRVPFKVGNQNKCFSVVLGDLTKVDAEAIACPTDRHFDYGDVGLQGILMRVAGRRIFEEAKEKARVLIGGEAGVNYITPRGSDRGLPFGFTIATSAGDLAKFTNILHVNSRVITGYLTREETVRLSVIGVLNVAEELKLKSVALPAFHHGISLDLVSGESIERVTIGVREFFTRHQEERIGLERILFVVYAQSDPANALAIQRFIQPHLT